MSNRSYLACTDLGEIYPSFSLGERYDGETHTLLACDECVPMLWFAGFAAADLQTRQFTVTFGRKKRTVTATAPVTTRARFVERLKGRAGLLNEMFPGNGRLDALVRALAEHVEKGAGAHVTIEYEEIGATAPEGALEEAVELVLKGLDAGDDSGKEYMVGISTIFEDLPFRGFDKVASSKRQEERWNVFRMIGGSWIRPAEWDFIDPNAELHRAVNASRPRNTFAVLLA